MPTSGQGFAWPLIGEKGTTRVSVKGPLSLNAVDLIRDAALEGHGLAYLPLDMVQSEMKEGRLVNALPGRVPDLPGYHLYYANRRNATAAFKLLVETLRWRG